MFVPETGLGGWIHIAAGTLGLLSGVTALAAAKGETLHRRAGTAFVAAMTVMAGSGMILATLFGHWESVLAGAVTLYLVVTAWDAARSADAPPVSAWHVVAAIGLTLFGLNLAAAAGMAPGGVLNGYPPELYMAFSGLIGWAALWDATALTYGRLSDAARLARHLWRMCMALAIAAAAFFLGQPDYFPESLRGTLVLALPPLAALALMMFWFVRVWIGGRFKGGAAR
jgi:uncharacterized membrane protein